jgi:hypothetical protein
MAPEVGRGQPATRENMVAQCWQAVVKRPVRLKTALVWLNETETENVHGDC